MTRREAFILVCRIRGIRYGGFDLSIPQAVDLIMETISGVQFSAEDIQAASKDYNVRLQPEFPNPKDVSNRRANSLDSRDRRLHSPMD